MSMLSVIAAFVAVAGVVVTVIIPPLLILSLLTFHWLRLFLIRFTIVFTLVKIKKMNVGALHHCRRCRCRCRCRHHHYHHR